MKVNVPVLKLQRFAEVDLETLRAEFEEEFTPEEIEGVEQIEDPDLDPEEDPEPEEEPDLDPEEDPEQIEDPEPEEDPETEEDVEDFGYQQSQKQKDKPKAGKQTREDNAAFAQLRKEKEALESRASIVEEFAAANGMTVEQYIAAVQQQKEAEEAKAAGVPLEYYQRSSQNEQRLSSLETQMRKDKFYASVDLVKEKYGLADEEVNGVFDYIGSQGLFDPQTKLPSVDFEFAYKAANFDTIQERKIQEAKQKDLAAKKKRQKTSAKPHNNSNASASKGGSKADMSVEDIEKDLRARNLI